jgi:methylenetetrahydrofolate reductase (NADPH)
MKITQHIEKSKECLLSLEVLPPTKGKNMAAVFEHLDPMMEFKPSWINVTYHRTETVFKKNGDGSFYKQEVRKRPGTVGICSALMNHYEVDAVPHIICGGFSKRETEDALLDLHYLGIDNILALRGDAEKNESSFSPPSRRKPICY